MVEETTRAALHKCALSRHCKATFRKLNSEHGADMLAVAAGWDVHSNHFIRASNAVQRLQWRLNRVITSRLPEGLSRESIQKIVDHYWATKGEARCRDAMAEVMAEGGQRVSTDHTYHLVSNLAAQDEDGKFVALKASLVSIMG